MIHKPKYSQIKLNYDSEQLEILLDNNYNKSQEIDNFFYL